MRQDVSGRTIRWNAADAAELVQSGIWTNKTIADYSAEWLARDPDHVVVIEGELEFKVHEIHNKAERLARALIRRGMRPGDTISFQLPNWHEAVVIGLAAAMGGFIFNPITPIYRDSEVSYMLGDSRSRIIFIPGVFRKYDFRAMMRRVLPSLDPAPEVIVVRGTADGFMEYEDLMAQDGGNETLPGADPNAVKMIMYTSGTTGRAKGVMHTHNSLQAENWARQDHLGVCESDILFNPSPVTHVTGALYSLCLPFTLGATTIMADVWDPAKALAIMARRKVTGMIASTIFLEALLKEAYRQNEHLPSLRFYLCGGAQVRPQLILDAADHFRNCVFARIYGSTEVPNITAGINSRDQMVLGAETDGQVWGTDVHIVDPVTGDSVPPGEDGEILARGPQMFVGYTLDSDSADAFDCTGFFRMGDLGRMVHGNYIRITGRKKDLIIRAGENISPKEVEDLLLDHPDIADVAIVAMPSERTGEMGCAFVIPQDGRLVDLPEVKRFLINAGIAPQKIPEHLEFVHDFERTSIGKVRKDVLRHQARKIADQ